MVVCKKKIILLKLKFEVIDSMEEFPILTDADILSRESAKVKHAKVSLAMAINLALRAKEEWSKEGEKNSRYLHHIASFRYKLNSINCIRIDNFFML